MALYPREYAYIVSLVGESRSCRYRRVYSARAQLPIQLCIVYIKQVITARVKSNFSIYNKMYRRGKKFGEIYDIEAIRVLVDSERKCYDTIEVIHSIWEPIQKRFYDYIVSPKTNGYQSLHTTVVYHGGNPLEIQVSTDQTHRHAYRGRACHAI